MLKLTAEPRQIFGKKLKVSRAAGQMPAVMYGAKQKAAEPLFVAQAEFKKVWQAAGESTMLTVEVGKTKHDVLVSEVVWHPVTGAPLHADFYLVDKTKTIEVTVPLHFTGVSLAVKDLSGTLVKVLHELTVEALPGNLPQNIEVDIAPLTTLESQILVKDLTVPAGVKILQAPEAVVASVGVVKEEVEEVAAAPDLSTIEVEKKGKEETPPEETPVAENA